MILKFSYVSFLKSKFPLPMQNLQQLHAQSIVTGLKSLLVYAKLIENYCATPFEHDAIYAHKVFELCGRSNVFLFNTLIRCIPPPDSIAVFANCHSKGEFAFDEHTYIFAFGACARLATASALYEGLQMHALASKSGFMSEIMLQTTVIHFYASNADIVSARKVFDEMCVRNTVTYGAMITGYNSHANPKNRHGYEALTLFRDMLSDHTGLEPTPTIMACVLSAVSLVGVLQNGACLHGFIKKKVYSPEDDVYIGTSLVDMYSKCGCLTSAAFIFRNMKERNVLTWTAMMAGLAFGGKGNEALELLNSMWVHNIKPNSVTFTCLLSACCHAGLVEEGLHLFRIMKSKFNITPLIQHYGCIVDLLGRTGQLNEAYELTTRMPIEPDAILWRALLGASMFHGDVRMAERVWRNLVSCQLNRGSLDSMSCFEDYVALSNVYADAGRWKDVDAVRKAMKENCPGIKPGHSSVFFPESCF